MKGFFRRMFAAVWACFAALALHGQNLIDLTYGAGAGDFELGTFIEANGNDVLAPGSTNLVGWVVDTNTIDRLSSQFGTISSGLLAIDLNGYFQSPGIVHTTVPTIPGEVYEVAYDVAAFIHFISPTDPKRAEVVAGNVTNNIVVTGPAIQATPIPLTWTRQSFRFTAFSSSSDITFRSLTPFDASGVLLDNVSVTHIVPVALGLEVKRVGSGNVRVRWPAGLSGYTLQAARHIDKKHPHRTRWVTVTETPVCGPSTCSVTTRISDYGKHFRLVPR